MKYSIEARIATRAYYIWLNTGCTDHTANWLTAEAIEIELAGENVVALRVKDSVKLIQNKSARTR